VNLREWTLSWHNTGINATLQQVLVIAFASLVAPKRAVGDEYKLISSLHFLPLNLLR